MFTWNEKLKAAVRWMQGSGALFAFSGYFPFFLSKNVKVDMMLQKSDVVHLFIWRKMWWWSDFWPVWKEGCGDRRRDRLEHAGFRGTFQKWFQRRLEPFPGSQPCSCSARNSTGLCDCVFTWGFKDCRINCWEFLRCFFVFFVFCLVFF